MPPPQVSQPNFVSFLELRKRLLSIQDGQDPHRCNSTSPALNGSTPLLSVGNGNTGNGLEIEVVNSPAVFTPGTGIGMTDLDVARTESSRRRNTQQGKLLLVTLLENYCSLYEQSKEQNQQLFLMLCQYLCRMGIIDSTDFLDEFTSVRSSYKRAFKELVEKALHTVRAQKANVILEEEGMESLPMVPSPSIGIRLRASRITTPSQMPSDINQLLDSTTHSRFQEDFAVISTLGSGAYGKVLKVLHNMDSRQYAIKMIKLQSTATTDLAKTLREVKLLAEMEHTNIVRYFGSWFQFTPQLDFGSDDESADEDEERQTPASTFSGTPATIPTFRPLTLFIQMELCEFTLKDWIEELNREINTFRRIEGKILFCFLDLLNGIKCIHDKAWIHRDIKPSNIYWKSLVTSPVHSPKLCSGSSDNPNSTFSSSATLNAGTWKVGDFGLASVAWSDTTSEDIFDSSKSKKKQSHGIGTVTYASPEQLLDFDDGLDESIEPYSYQTDIFSLGIILFELLVPFGSAMERVQVLTELRQGLMPESFVTDMPKEAALILWMMSKEPVSRPSVNDIMQLEWFAMALNKEDGNTTALLEELRLAKVRIQSLEEQNFDLQKQLCLLKKT